MRAMFAAFAAVIIIAIAAPFVLEQFGFSSAERYSASDVRLD